MNSVKLVSFICLIPLALLGITPSATTYIAYAGQHLLHNGHIDKIFFMPPLKIGPNAKSVLLGLIHNERQAIYIAQYRLTDKDLSEALKQALGRGIHVEIITDQGCLKEKSEQITALKKQGALVYVYGKAFSLMHIKMFLFSYNYLRKISWFGSANATGGGMTRNHEMVSVRDNSMLYDQCLEHFNHMKMTFARSWSKL